MEDIYRKELRAKKKRSGNQAAALLKIMRRYMPELWNRLDQMKDPRHSSYIIYLQRVMIAVVLLKNITGLKTMNEMTDVFNTEEYIRNIGKMCGVKDLEEIPHMVTVNNYLSRLEPENLEKIRSRIIYDLIRCRAFEQARYRRRWLIAIDGTKLCSFKEENDLQCLHVTHKKVETEKNRRHGIIVCWKQKLFLGKDWW